MTDPEVIDQASTEVAEYNPIAAGLAALRQQYGNLTFDLSTTAGDRAARSARLELVTLRTTLEKRRKELKAPLIERAKLIDDEAKRITGEIVALENPIDAQIKADEKRRAEEKAAREKAERERIAALDKRLLEITGIPVQCATSSGDELNRVVTYLQQLAIGDDWQEYRERAEAARQQVLDALRTLHRAAVIREEQELARKAEEERLATERKALEEQRAAQEAEQRKWREEAERAEREAKERREAEEARLAAERAEIERQRAELTKPAEPPAPESTGAPPPVAPQLIGFPLSAIGGSIDFSLPEATEEQAARAQISGVTSHMIGSPLLGGEAPAAVPSVIQQAREYLADRRSPQPRAHDLCVALVETADELSAMRRKLNSACQAAGERVIRLDSLALKYLQGSSRALYIAERDGDLPPAHDAFDALDDGK